MVSDQVPPLNLRRWQASQACFSKGTKINQGEHHWLYFYKLLTIESSIRRRSTLCVKFMLCHIASVPAQRNNAIDTVQTYILLAQWANDDSDTEIREKLATRKYVRTLHCHQSEYVYIVGSYRVNTLRWQEFTLSIITKPASDAWRSWQHDICQNYAQIHDFTAFVFCTPWRVCNSTR